MFRQRSFASLWWGQIFSITGDRFTYLALAGLFYEHSQTDAAASYAALLAVFANVVVAPVLLFAPFTGAWVDRHNLKHVLVVSDALRALIVLTIPTLFQLTHSTDVVFALVFALFTVNVVFLPAKSALLPTLVAPDRLVSANSLVGLNANLARLAGGPIGGLLLAASGLPAIVAVDAVSFLVAALLIWRLPASPPRSAGSGSRVHP